MTEIRNAMATFSAQLRSLVNTIGPADILDMLIVAFLIYHAIRLVRETRAMQLLKGIAVILVLYVLALNLNLITLTFLLTNILQWGIVAIAIVFQPELRRALEQVGRSKISNISIFGPDASQTDGARLERLLTSVTDAAEYFSAHKTGALMVLERETRLGDVVATGTVIDAEPTTELICNIFFINSPLHDGAMVIRNTKLYAAGCFLPLSDNDEIGRELGTRHRAALGMSEVSDAVVVVVSEETGAISVAMNSRLQRNLSVHTLRTLLQEQMSPDRKGEDKEKKKRGLRRKSK